MQPAAPEPDREAAKSCWALIQDDNGVDLTLIRANLRLTPAERLRRAESARLAALRLQELGRLARERRERSA
jgi:hypothetical protein